MTILTKVYSLLQVNHKVGTASTSELCKISTKMGGDETGLEGHQYLHTETQNEFPWANLPDRWASLTHFL